MDANYRVGIVQHVLRIDPPGSPLYLTENVHELIGRCAHRIASGEAGDVRPSRAANEKLPAGGAGCRKVSARDPVDLSRQLLGQCGAAAGDHGARAIIRHDMSCKNSRSHYLEAEGTAGELSGDHDIRTGQLGTDDLGETAGGLTLRAPGTFAHTTAGTLTASNL